MSVERYRQIDALAEAALQIDGARRSDFLERACGSDRDLFERVNDLLRAYETAGDFLERPAFEAWARDVAGSKGESSLAGRMVGRYSILSRLGSGGIGEVWLARDTELGREVALKFLSPELAGDSDQARRFRQEARAASALSHPRLVTIFDIGEFEGRQFIAQEYIPGKTVREALAAGPFALKTIAGIAAQIAAGLSAAHAAGIVHRDIKPENIMIRPDGAVKIVDFGIARFMDDSTVPRHNLSTGLTRPGFILGTARYMSPEQARGLPVDGRSDIFSLGVVLYEMVTGTTPFAGGTPSDVLAAILTFDPAPLSRNSRVVPASMERIVRRCLAKDPAARYASAAELGDDLQRLTARETQPARRLMRWAAGLAAVVAIAAVGLIMLMNMRQEPQPAFASMHMTRIATRGEVSDVTIARDGSLLAYVEADGAGSGVWVKDASGAHEREVIATVSGQVSGITISPDDSFLYFRRRENEEIGDLYRLPVKGGHAERVIGEVSGAAALSPDGKQIAFIRLKPSVWEASLVVSNADGTGEFTLQTVRRPQFFDEHSVAWSPDGQRVACFAGEATQRSDAAIHLVEVNVLRPSQRLISRQSWVWPQSVAWPAQGNVLIVTAATPGELDQLWTVRADTGEVTRLTNDLSYYGRVSVTDDGKSLVTVQHENSVSIWVAARNGGGFRPERISAAPLPSTRVAVAWTPDGQVVYSDPADGYRNLWRMDAGGANPRQLTFSPGNKDELVLTHDGKTILYQQDSHIWRVNSDGSHAQQLTNGRLEVHPDASPDGKTVVFASFADWAPGVGGEPTLWRVPLDGGQASQISSQPASVPSVSLDGKQIACIHFPAKDPRISSQLLAVLREDGAGGFTIFDRSPSDGTTLAWSPDGKALDYVVNANGVGNIWRQPLNGGPTAQVTHFDTDNLYHFAWYRDGRLLCTRGNTTHSAILITNFR
jgi:Tol biopolymer transport system component